MLTVCISFFQKNISYYTEIRGSKILHWIDINGDSNTFKRIGGLE